MINIQAQMNPVVAQTLTVLLVSTPAGIGKVEIRRVPKQAKKSGGD